MGHVFRAWDARLQREVAIKLLNLEYAMPGMRERFLREARAASALNHPNICTVFDIGEQDGDPYLVMELLEGQTLKDRILSRGLQLEEMIGIAREVAEALGAAHLKGVVHRDIKPANIFLVEKPNGGIQAKVLDFGLAKIGSGVLAARGRSLDLTTAGAAVGTLAYMSPEQARGEVLDSRSDLFSLGVVLYEMTTRQVPFQGATSALVFVQLLNHPPEPVRAWNDAIPRDFEKIILKLLAKEKTARFQTARELELALIALGEKGTGGWLRKAVAAAPLTRVPDALPRDRKASRLRSTEAESLAEGAGATGASESAAAAKAAEAAPAAQVSTSTHVRGASAPEQLLRPVARIPQADPRPSSTDWKPRPTGQEPRAASQEPRRAGQEPQAGSQEPRAHSSITRHAAGSGRSPETVGEPVQENEAGTSGPGPSPGESDQPGRETQGPGPDGLPTFFEAPDDEKFPPLFAPSKPRWLPFSPLWLWFGGAGFLVLVAAAIFHHGRLGATVLAKTDAVVVTEIENRTGSQQLDDSVAEGLRIALQQSPYLLVPAGGAYRAASRLVVLAKPRAAGPGGLPAARKIAERLGAKVYLYGSVRSAASMFLLHVDAYAVSSNEVIASADAHVDTVEQMPAAIDQVASNLRLNLGEPRTSIEAASTPLAREGTANLAALARFAHAGQMLSMHDPLAALANLQQVIALDPRFVQALLLMAKIEDQLHAETAAADAGRRALAAADGSGERTKTLAQVAYEIESTGDYPKATALLRHLLTHYPSDAEASSELAKTLRLEGHMAEALQLSQQAYAIDPLHAQAYQEAETALVGLDRYDAAFQLDAQVERLGLARAGDALIFAYLDGRRPLTEYLAAKIPLEDAEYRNDRDLGLFLDDQGRLAAGADLWRSRARAASANPQLKSAAAYLLAQAALDRALLGECRDAFAIMAEAPGSGISKEAGRVALFNSGMAFGLCGDRPHAEQAAAELKRRYPQSFDVRGYYVADIQAAIAIRSRTAVDALVVLNPARSFDLISLSPYLRGLAHIAVHQVELAIVDFQTILSHHGLTFIVGNTLFPAAQAGVARAFASSGDVGNSAEAYRKLIAMWDQADPGIGLLREAKANVPLQ